MSRQNKNHYLHFTKKERNGTAFLLLIILLIALIPFLVTFFYKKEIPSVLDYTNEVEALKQKQAENSRKKFANTEDSDPYEHYYPKKENSYSAVSLHPFYFDPNTLSADGWKKMGIREKTIATIQNYLSKGGRFKVADDIKKIWGIKEEEAEQLIPWIRIAETDKAAEKKYAIFETKKEYEKVLELIDINQADSSAWESLPGIGAKLSQRIVNFRNKLGGFYKIDQVGETFGLPDSTFQLIRKRLELRGREIKTIDINTATVEELKLHPYIRYNLANAIVQYRTQHGNFAQAEDLKKIMLIDEITYTKISPYIRTND
ncbi:MAG: helix-hairpin-helix domain-containing protein [Ferruginibacter sp.]